VNHDEQSIHDTAERMAGDKRQVLAWIQEHVNGG
jgi:hypothetical protein